VLLCIVSTVQRKLATLMTANHASPRVLFVLPPTGMMYRCLLPLSLPAVINRLSAPVVEYYENELTDGRLRGVEIVIVPVHWYLNLPGAAALARRLRAWKPSLVLIAGGLTASLFARQLVDEIGFDYVVRGDGEKPLADLVTALLAGERIDRVPNVVGRNGLATPWSWHVSGPDLATNDYLDVSFFPSLQRDLRRFHRGHTYWPVAVHPWLVPFRGCPRLCPVCAGSRDKQRELFGRDSVIRPPEAVAEDLARLEGDSQYRFINCYHDFLTLLPGDYAATVLRRRSRLALYMELAALPTREQLSMLLDSFAGGRIAFSIDNHHTTSPEPVDPALLIDRMRLLRRHPNYAPMLVYSKIFWRQYPDYRRAVSRIVRATGCCLQDGSYYWPDFPRIQSDGSGDPDDFALALQPPHTMKFLWWTVGAQLGRLTGGSLLRRYDLALGKLFYKLTENLPYHVKDFFVSRRDERSRLT